jgi:hypothetical protein
VNRISGQPRKSDRIASRFRLGGNRWHSDLNTDAQLTSPIAPTGAGFLGRLLVLIAVAALTFGAAAPTASASPQAGGGAESAMGCAGTIDECGVCDGDNSTCAGCDGIPNSGLVFDQCGVCDGADACVGCDGVPFSGLVFDQCGVCDGSDACVGCDGVPLSGLVFDQCGVCDGNDACLSTPVPVSGGPGVVGLSLSLVALASWQLNRARSKRPKA